nr:NINE protein [Bacillus benzoevorans]
MLGAHYTKSKVVAGLLGILLGGIGAHKFYLGRWGWGIIYLLFCWTYIPLVLGLIEGILYLVSNDDDFARKYDKGYRRMAG